MALACCDGEPTPCNKHLVRIAPASLPAGAARAEVRPFAGRTEMSGTSDFAKTLHNTEGPKKIATPIVINGGAPGLRADAARSNSLDNVAAWANEGGAGGEVIR